MELEDKTVLPKMGHDAKRRDQPYSTPRLTIGCSNISDAKVQSQKVLPIQPLSRVS